jgi:hypothetical protein
VSDKKEAMELVFNLDEASVRFWVPALRLSKERAKWHGVLIVLGNSPEEIVSDWNYFADDRDGFNAAMDAFDSERYA